MKERNIEDMMNFIKSNNTDSLHEKVYGGILLCIIGGFLEAHTFLLRGGVFCNAQTGNIVLFIMNMFQGHFKQSLYYPAPILFFIFGILITRFLAKKFSHDINFKWEYILMFFEFLLLSIVGLIPLGSGDKIANIIVSFVCAIQYNTFRSTDGMLYSSVFCTNNLRLATENLYDAISNKSKKTFKVFAKYTFMILAFCLGAAIQTLIAPFCGSFSVFICSAILIVTLTIDYIRYHNLT